MASHPALAKSLVKWSGTNRAAYDMIVWSLVGEALQQLRGPGGVEQGERQALYRRFDAVLRGAGADAASEEKKG